MKPKGWRGESRRHSLASKGISTAKGEKVCDVPDPMNTRSNQQLLFGHSSKNHKEILSELIELGSG